MTVVFQHEILLQQRKKQHLTQEALAELCGCSPRYLRTLESGAKRNPSTALVRRMAVVLALPEEVLLPCRRDEIEYFLCSRSLRLRY